MYRYRSITSLLNVERRHKLCQAVSLIIVMQICGAHAKDIFSKRYVGSSLPLPRSLARVLADVCNESRLCASARIIGPGRA